MLNQKELLLIRDLLIEELNKPVGTDDNNSGFIHSALVKIDVLEHKWRNSCGETIGNLCD